MFGLELMDSNVFYFLDYFVTLQVLVLVAGTDPITVSRHPLMSV